MKPKLVSDERLKHIVNDAVAIACLGGYCATSARVAAELAARTVLKELGIVQVERDFVVPNQQCPFSMCLNPERGYDEWQCALDDMEECPRKDCPLLKGAILVRAKDRTA